MVDLLYARALRPALFALGGDPEVAHERVLSGLAAISRSPLLLHTLASSTELGYPLRHERSAVEVFGLRFPNPIGLAAGFDKNARAVPALAALGFGFVEVGTVTLHAQPGNPRPRLFRLPSERALINRMGFNNDGAARVAARLARLARLPAVGIPIGISLGKSKVTPLEGAVEDYLGALETLYPYGDYFAVNVSSPNTPDLRALQQPDHLDPLLAALTRRLRQLAADAGRAEPKPLLVKVAPDLEERDLEALVDVCLERAASGLIAVNTTLARDGLSARVPSSLAAQPGGLSGRPLRERALAVVRILARASAGRLPIVGCGGIANGDDARRMLDAGATLLQLYTSFIYEGPGIARRLAAAISSEGRT